MGELLLDWARNILFFMVFLSVVSHLLADRSYEKYIRFFAGMVLILITISPLKGGLNFQEQNFLISGKNSRLGKYWQMWIKKGWECFFQNIKRRQKSV